jgi:c-di-GMP-binding flagellar brake protein YcgR
MNSVHQDFTDDIRSSMGINDLLQVEIVDDPNPAVYQSRIEDIIEGKLVIAWPTSGGLRLLLHRDQILKFSFVRDGVPYAFRGLVDNTNPKPSPQITVILSSAVVRIQQRQDFRIKCAIPVEIVGTFEEDVWDAAPLMQVFRTKTLDLSAGGMAIQNAKPIPENTLLDVRIALPDDESAIRVTCRVVYCKHLIDTLMQYRIGMHFLELGESERARIVRFVYRTQLKGLCA